MTHAELVAQLKKAQRSRASLKGRVTVLEKMYDHAQTQSMSHCERIQEQAKKQASHLEEIENLKQHLTVAQNQLKKARADIHSREDQIRVINAKLERIKNLIVIWSEFNLKDPHGITRVIKDGDTQVLRLLKKVMAELLDLDVLLGF